MASSGSGPETNTLKAICEAIKADDLEKIHVLLNEIPSFNLNQEWEEGVYPIHLACTGLNGDIVNRMIQHGVDVNIPGSDGKTVLHDICKTEERKSEALEILEILLNSGAVVDVADNMECTPLFHACENDDVKMVKILINKGANVNVQTVSGETPIKVSCRNAEFWFFWQGREASGGTKALNPDTFPPVQITKLLLQAGADPKQATFLPSAVQFGFIDLVIELLDLGMDINMLDDHQRTPLGFACFSASVHTDVVRLLLTYGADVNKGGGWNRQKPVIFAYVHNSVEKLKLLLSYGAHVTGEVMTELVSVSLSKSILENPEVVTLFSKELMSWRLLLSAGFQPQFSGALATKYHQIELCSSYHKIKTWIPSLVFPLRTLKDFCRIAIRKSLPTSIDRNIQFLPLPHKLKDFLVFKEYSLRDGT
ncbi:hypothetical protein SNE40_016534 [Patella caerulea]|uniref:SOCS box domain-containing protein n=1 Tax=Patella caerulea TaxID=87958 RepID=A0AAN8PJF8_PATCE